MSAKARPWLPPQALECPRVRALANESIVAWAGKWFARAQAIPTEFAAHPKCCPLVAGGWHKGRAVATAAPGAELIRLAGLALGMGGEQPILSEADGDILGRFGRAIAADLGATLDTALGLDPSQSETSAVEEPFAGAGGLGLCLTDGGGQRLLRVAIPSAPLIAFHRAGISARRRRPASLGRLTDAVGSSAVHLQARLGRASLPLGELARLGVGDVLVLDRKLDDGAELVLRETGRTVARGTLAAGNDRVALLLHS